jgi:hypothetical protein
LFSSQLCGLHIAFVFPGAGMDKKPSKRDAFEEYLGAIEGNGPQTTLFATLQAAGMPLPNPDDVPEREMSVLLWKVIHALWDEGVVLYSTNHLSDRELYTLMWTELLIEDHQVFPEDFPVTTHIDILGGWSQEDTEMFLRYYADEETRREWASDYGKTIPEHVDPPYDRDQFLPGH